MYERYIAVSVLVALVISIILLNRHVAAQRKKLTEQARKADDDDARYDLQLW